MKSDFDIAVVGSGFAGSLIATIARHLGRSVILLERGQHPRFAIGESSTPLANLLIDELARRYDLPQLLPFTKWGTWQREHPEVACGLKRGFTFYHHRIGDPLTPDPQHLRQLLVAASPRDEIGDLHWYRPDFDHWLVQEAQSSGVEYIDRVQIDSVRFEVAGATLAGTRNAIPLTVRARFVIDASGPRGFLHRALHLPEITFSHLPPTQALFSHFKGVRRLSEMEFNRDDGAAPFPVDDAAVHHVFDGGWIWVLRFNNGITSAGIAATDELADQFRFADGSPAWERLLDRLPTVREQFEHATSTIPFIRSPRLAFRSSAVVGPSWALLPSAAGFVDPLLSTGFPLTLLGVGRLARILEDTLAGRQLELALNEYSRQTLAELDATEQVIGALYASMDDPETFNALTLLYFAAATWSETVRRLHHPERAAGFLLRDDPQFGPATREICTRVLAMRRRDEWNETSRNEIIREVQETIRPFDVAGLTSQSRRNWYPVQIDDLLRAHGRLGVSADRVKQMLRECGALVDECRADDRALSISGP